MGVAYANGHIDLDDAHSVELLQATLDTIPDPIFVKNREHQWVAFNEGFAQLLERSREEILGRSDPDFFPPDQVEVFWRLDHAVLEQGQPADNEEQITDASGVVHTIWTRKFPIRNRERHIVGLCGIITDVTEQRARREREQRELIEAQTAMLDALAMPIVEVWEGVLLMSLIGEMTAGRAERAMEALLEAICARRTRVVLLDVTGMPQMDTSFAHRLQSIVRATGLLGCEAVLCGVGPSIAGTLSSLDIDLGDVRSCASVRQGLAWALTPRR